MWSVRQRYRRHTGMLYTRCSHVRGHQVYDRRFMLSSLMQMWPATPVVLPCWSYTRSPSALCVHLYSRRHTCNRPRCPCIHSQVDMLRCMVGTTEMVASHHHHRHHHHHHTYGPPVPSHHNEATCNVPHTTPGISVLDFGRCACAALIRQAPSPPAIRFNAKVNAETRNSTRTLILRRIYARKRRRT
jgi:hypothetical protein